MDRKTDAALQAQEWEAEIQRLRALQEKKPTFERHMQLDHATKMAAGARLRARS